ncbi:MAG: hypothetical protein QM625_24090 [Ralstonia sp.]|jgi:hypothetical protein|nr:MULTISPECIES: hypothetical protein [Burkholderiaceae]EFP66195.1 hypothetical protein HMPREF1004_02206 [Ralstonia pickettii]
MKNFILAAMVVGALAGCSDKPRGPVEVLGKTYMVASTATQVEFTNKDTATATDLSTGKHQEWKYTLQGDVMTITMPWGNGQPRTFDLHRNGNDFSGDLSIAPKSPADDARIEKIKQQEQEKKASEERSSPKGSPSDKSAYAAIKDIGDENNEWYVWTAMAWNAKDQNDESKLGILSRVWYSTNDSFARQAVKDKELVRINKKLDDVKKIDYVAVSESKGDPDFVSFDTISDKAGYDFDKKGFRVIGSICAGNLTSLGGKSGVRYRFIGDGPICFLPVADEEAAKKIEALRSTSQSGSLRIATTVYSKIAGMNGAELQLVPVGADYAVYKRSYKPNTPDDLIATASYWPYK